MATAKRHAGPRHDLSQDFRILTVRVPDGTNEITQADALLDALKIPGGESVLVTIDAAHTQRETAEAIGEEPRGLPKL